MGVAFADAVGVRPSRYVAGAEQIACRKKVSCYRLGCVCLLLDRARMQRIVWPRPAARQLTLLGMAGRTGDSGDSQLHNRAKRPAYARHARASKKDSFFFWYIRYCTKIATNIDDMTGGARRARAFVLPGVPGNMACGDQHQLSTRSGGCWHVLLIHRWVSDSKDIQHGPEDTLGGVVVPPARPTTATTVL